MRYDSLTYYTCVKCVKGGLTNKIVNYLYIKIHNSYNKCKLSSHTFTEDVLLGTCSPPLRVHLSQLLMSAAPLILLSSHEPILRAILQSLNLHLPLD